MKKGYWRMRDGKLIKIKEMTDNHLFNSAKMMAFNGCDWKGIFGYELKRRKIDTKKIEEIELFMDEQEHESFDDFMMNH